MNEFVARLKQRKLVQWALAYVAFAFALIQVADVVAQIYHWPDGAMHIVFGLLALGLVVALVLAWYHGERGAQKVSGTEIVILALLLARRRVRPRTDHLTVTVSKRAERHKDHGPKVFTLIE